MLQNILIPIDFSPSAARALTFARHNFPQARRKLLHVLDARAVAVTDYTSGSMVPIRPDAETQRALSQVDDAALGAIMVEGEEYELVTGDPVGAILAVAERSGTDLIVMGTHGRRGLQHLFVGSVAEQVVRRSPIPVLTIRGEDDPAA